MKTRWIIKATIIATVLVCLTACGSQGPSGSGANSKPNSEMPSVPSEPENEDKDKESICCIEIVVISCMVRRTT